MALIDLDLDPDRMTLRRFGFASLVVFGALAALGHTVWTFPSWLSLALVVLSVGSGICAALWPRLNLPLYLLLNVVFYPVGLVVSYVVLAVLFYGVLTPVSLVFRLVGRDALRRSMDREATSYWIPHVPPKDAGRYFRPF